MDNRPILTENAKRLLYQRYLRKNKNGEVVETPREMIERISHCLSYSELLYCGNGQRECWYNKIKEALLDLAIMPSSPILFNARNPDIERPGMLFACYFIPMGDSIEEIYECLKLSSRIFSNGGGIGTDVSNLREAGADIGNGRGVSTGPLAFLNVMDASSDGILAGGSRRAAALASMDVSHPDIEGFLHVKNINLQEINKLLGLINSSNDQALIQYAEKEIKKLQNLTHFNLSVRITDAFLDAVENNKDWELISPHTQRVVRTIPAVKLFNTLCKCAHRAAEPGIFFIDEINRHNPLPNLGRINGTNACVTGDTKILTKDGYVAIKNCIGRQTVVWNGETWSAVVPFATGRNRIYKVVLSNGVELCCTNYHKFILHDRRNPKKVALADLTVGDKLAKFTLPTVHVGHDPKIDAYSHGFYCGDGTANKSLSHLYFTKFCIRHRLIGRFGKERVNNKDVRCQLWHHGKMPCRDFVPTNATAEYCIAWLSGLLDADGTVLSYKNSDALQVSSINKQFLLDVILLLSRLGVQAKLGIMHKEGHVFFDKHYNKEYDAKICYRLCINCADTQKLLALGLDCGRLKIKKAPVQRDARRFVTIVDIIDTGCIEPTYCFNEPVLHNGVFNGILTGNCSELPLHDYTACNLISVNLNKCLFGENDLTFSFSELRRLARIAARAAENVIDVSLYLDDRIERLVKGTRGIGVGICGFADILVQLGIAYNSQEARDLLSKICATLTEASIEESKVLANERGAFKLYHGSLMEIKGLYVRNAYTTCLQPTGSTAIVAGASQSIEPYYALYYNRKTHDNQVYIELNDYFIKAIEAAGLDKNMIIDKLKKHGTIQVIDEIPENLKRIFITAHDLSPEEHIKMQAAAQRNIHASISKTVNLPASATVKDVANAYLLAAKSGCKGCTVYREGSREGVLHKVQDEIDCAEQFRDFLYDKYVKKNYTAKEIAEVLDVSEAQIFAKLKRYGIKKDAVATAACLSEVAITDTLRQIILANIIVGHSRLTTVAEQSSFRLISDHLPYVQNVRQKFIDKNINCSDIDIIVTHKTFYYFDTCFLHELYDLPVDLDSVITLKSKEDIITLLMPLFVRHLFLVGGVHTKRGGIQFKPNSRNGDILNKLMGILGQKLNIKICFHDDGSVYVPKSSVNTFYTFIENGDATNIFAVTDEKCPECGDKLIWTEGCCHCQSCQWSKCSL